MALRKGEVIPGRSVSVVSENEAMAVLDGNHGFGQTIGPQAVQVGIRKAQRLGLSVVALRHTAHIGRIGEWAELAAAAGLISVHFVNVPGSVL
ncbi:MAG: Ldh family oxidoreductase, partial [bacterium]|nr:Ldh family oxidoreductase [bacterium]